MASVSVLLVRPLVAAVGTAGLEALFGATDLTPQLLGDDDARISPAQFCVAWSEAIRITNNRQLALAIATATPPGSFGIVEYVCRSAPTLRVALLQWVRYLNLLDDAVTVALVIDEERAYLRVERESEAPAPASHELCWALVAKYARELSTLPFRLTAVELAHPAHGDPAAYRAWFDAPVVFDADTTQLVMPRAALDTALVSTDATLLRILTRAADEALAKMPADPLMTSQVKRVLHELLRNDEGHVDVVSKRLGMTSRSLQRRLKDESTTFNAIREVVRRELAQRYLDDGLAIAEISFLLGFSEPSAFFRAFKRWTGTTPRARAQPA
ncbi:MAG: AraC family transcriptional regulator [Myxococcota bacterium]|nr:AraC family transcriptional regulator [Deltaproteobacteria bacterium]MDQ3335920.1 AraC family transcriptional regulator [Myxococcota bacterium]